MINYDSYRKKKKKKKPPLWLQVIISTKNVLLLRRIRVCAMITNNYIIEAFLHLYTKKEIK